MIIEFPKKVSDKTEDVQKDSDTIENIVEFPKAEDHPDFVQENFEKLLEGFKGKKVDSYFVVISDEESHPNLSVFCDWKPGHRLTLVGGIEAHKLHVLGSQRIVFEGSSSNN